MKAGFPITPDNLGSYPFLPKKTDDISDEEYQAEMKKYWNDQKKKKNKQRKEKKQASKAKKIENKPSPDIQEKTINISKKENSKYPTFAPRNPNLLETLKNYPDYPQCIDGMSKKDYHQAVKKYFKLKVW